MAHSPTGHQDLYLLMFAWEGPRTQSDMYEGLKAAVAGQRVGYRRVSTLDQNGQHQLDGLVLDRVFTDKASGRDMARPQLTELLRFAQDGDTVVVHSMDRLARTLDDLRALVQRLTHKGVRVEFVKEHLLFTGEDLPMANLMLRHERVRGIRTLTD